MTQALSPWRSDSELCTCGSCHVTNYRDGVTTSDLSAGFEYLSYEGLNLAAVLDIGQLAPEILGQMHLQPGHHRILLLANGGRRLWDRLGGRPSGPDPVDRHSRATAEGFMTRYVGGSFETLYPLADGFVPLQALGRAAGWTHPSPVGLDITAEFGLWFAYRAVVATSVELPVTVAGAGPSPCASCKDQPCIGACPAAAVQLGGLDGERCMSYRLTEGSECADKCLARLACPVAPEHRYSLEQVHYHYGLSLETIKSWSASAGS